MEKEADPTCLCGFCGCPIEHPEHWLGFALMNLVESIFSTSKYRGIFPQKNFYGGLFCYLDLLVLSSRFWFIYRDFFFLVHLDWF